MYYLSLPKMKSLLRRGAGEGEVERGFNRFCVADPYENISLLIN